MQHVMRCVAGLVLFSFVTLAQSEKSESNLTVVLRDSLGLRLPKGKLTVRSSDSKVMFSGAVEDSVDLRLPYGRYQLSFETEFFVPAEKSIAVEHARTLVVLGANMDRFVLDARHDPVAVTVKVSPSESCTHEKLWVKLTGLFSDYIAERDLVSVGLSRVALFEPVEIGTYVIAVLDGQHARAVGTVQANRQINSVELSLSSCGENSHSR